MADWPVLAGPNSYDNMGSVPASSAGTTLTAGAANVKGAYAQLIASTAQEYAGLIVQYHARSSTKYGIDLAVGAGGAEQIIVPDLITDDARTHQTLYLPISVAKGARLAARCQSPTASANLWITVQGIPSTPRTPEGYQEATSYGFNAATTGGILLDCGATANTDVIVDLANTTTKPIHCLYLMAFQATGPTANVDLLIDVGLYDGITFFPVIDDIMIRNVNAGRLSPQVYGPIFVDIPSGSRIAARGRASGIDAGGRTLDLVLLGLA